MISRAAIRAALVVATSLVALAVSSCGRAGDDPGAAPTSMSAALRLDSGDEVGEIWIDRTQLEMGQRAELRVVLMPDRPVDSVELTSPLPEDLELVTEHSSGSSHERSHVLTLEPLLPGEYELASIDLALVRGDVRVAAHADLPLVLRVASAFAENESPELAEVKGIVDPAPESIPWWVWLAIVAGALAVLGIGAVLIVRSSRARESRPIYRVADELALERLARLESQDLVSKGELARLHAEASLILRRYIEDRYELHAPERTSDEFLREARSSPSLAEGDVIALEVFLRQCDLIKFAAQQPLREQAERTIETVRDFVERTRSPDRLVAFRNGQIVGRFDRRELERVA